MPRVPIETVVPDPNQPRKSFGDQADRELMASIKTHCLLQPPVVTPDGNGKFKIVAGERRYRACKALGWTELPVTIINEVKHPRAVQLVENLQRKDLTALEEAHAIKALIDEHGHTQKEVARLLNKSPAYVSERLTLLKLSPHIQQLHLDGELGFSHLKHLAQAPEEVRDQLATEAAKNKDSVRETRKKVGAKKKGGQSSAASSPDEHVTKAQNLVTKARANIDTALKHLSQAADGYDEHDQYSLADAVEHLEQADSLLKTFFKESSEKGEIG